MTTPPQLSARDLRKEFGGGRRGEPVVAVDGIDFEVARGGALAIVGESGSGKTTVVRMMAGLETPTSGELLLDGAPLVHSGRGAEARLARARRIQMVFQDPYSSLDPRQTIGDGLAEILRLHGIADRDACEEVALTQLRRVGLDQRHLSMRPGSLSGGQRQRVAIARALAVDPEVLILDEAVAALDVSIQAQILNLLNDLRAESEVTYLFVTHDLAVAQQVTDTAIVMHRGRVVEEGTTDAVLTDPQADYTRRLLDAVPHRGWKPRRRLAASA
ncbi:ABC transporter ATP-binding protein [Mumia zhuanghuii]|uniref:ABC transporter ATP-binding protein n=2 Tax=Mumia TaxID=1546255 RepID=A0ABW1QKR3_9ACTN|nr:MULTISPECIES: ATP-binding cassette domain-containing protein [Mumia]KAA1418219.1 ABC transporter ATP-binding protein [Mumia zhuanghuii]